MSLKYLGNIKLFNEAFTRDIMLKNHSLKSFVEKNTIEYTPEVIKKHTAHKEEASEGFLDSENLLYKNLESIKEICEIIREVFAPYELEAFAEFLNIIEKFKNDINMNYINSNMSFELDAANSYDPNREILLNTQIYISEFLTTIKLICLNIKTFYNNWERGENMFSNYDYEKIYISNYDSYDTHIFCSNGLNPIVAEVNNDVLAIQYLQLPLLSSKYITGKTYNYADEDSVESSTKSLKYKRVLYMLIRKSLLYECFIQDIVRFGNIFFPRLGKENIIIDYRNFLDYYLKNISLFIKIVNYILFEEIKNIDKYINEFHNILVQNMNCDLNRCKDFTKSYNCQNNNEVIFMNVLKGFVENYEVQLNGE